MPWAEHPVSIEAEGRLAGTLTRPTLPAGPVPGVIIVAGSGPVDRDGNVPGLANDSLKHLARGLAEHGIASLRTDKRGVGASAVEVAEADLRFGTYVRDTCLWAEALRGEPGIASVALLGHSEGALVATLAAKRAQAAGLVLLAGAGTPAGPIMERQFAAGGLPDDLRRALRRILQELASGRTATDVPPALAAVFRPSVQPYLMSWLPIDPAVALSRVTVPVLVVQGTTDLQTGPADARILAAARPGAVLRLIDGMNHVLRAAPSDRAANVATYRDPGLPLHPALLPALLPALG